MNIKVFAPGTEREEDVDAILAKATHCTPIMPFAEELIGFVKDLAYSLLLDKETRSYPELMVLANFFKTINFDQMIASVGKNDEVIKLPRGFVFHISPSNVDSIFLYSSLISFLCGNVNVIRISNPKGSQILYVLNKLRALFAEKYCALESRFIVCTYEYSETITEKIAAQCNMRVVWGGDATVARIRSIPLRPTALEICFPDRFSAAMLNAKKVQSLGATELIKLCTDLYNDATWFSQQACSSPRLIAWIGTAEDCENAQAKLWLCFSEVMRRKHFNDEPGMAMDRFVATCMVSCAPLFKSTTLNTYPTRIALEAGAISEIKKLHCGNGLFFEQSYESAPAFFQTLSDLDQTISVYGFRRAELILLAKDLPMRAVDRFVDIGRSLDFGRIWDGLDLYEVFTRKIFIHVASDSQPVL
jgi:hypothetical protein